MLTLLTWLQPLKAVKADGEDLATKHARKLWHLERLLQEALQALSSAPEKQQLPKQIWIISHILVLIMLQRQQAEAEDLASKHARELQRLRGSLQEALQALSHAKDEHAAAEMQFCEDARELRAQHEQLSHKLQAQHKREMQVSAALLALHSLLKSFSHLTASCFVLEAYSTVPPVFVACQGIYFSL